jgi:hypothetical protein
VDGEEGVREDMGDGVGVKKGDSKGGGGDEWFVWKVVEGSESWTCGEE